MRLCKAGATNPIGAKTKAASSRTMSFGARPHTTSAADPKSRPVSNALRSPNRAMNRPQDASDGRDRDEADAPRGSDHPERAGASLDRCHVGHVGRGGREAGGHDPGQDAPDEEPR